MTTKYFDIDVVKKLADPIDNILVEFDRWIFQEKISIPMDITKTCLYNLDPLKPHFYIVKLGFTGVCIIFLISAPKHRLWVLVRTASPENFMFLEVNFFIYLNRRVFVMNRVIALTEQFSFTLRYTDDV